jgi:hypothetical protein
MRRKKILRKYVNIAVINESTVVKDSDALACVDALQIQVSRDFAPAWGGIDAHLMFIPRTNPPMAPAPNQWQLVILDDSDQADALGYHELTASGLPLGKVFAKSDLDAGYSWTVTASHELLEMLADPNINDVAELDNADGTITFYAHEVCDAVEADDLGYEIDGVLLSDFVTPSWFVSGETGAVDFMHRVSNPFQIAPGGYISVLQIPSSAAGWTQITADHKPGGPVAQRGSRRWRRSLPDSQWRKSTR